MSNTLPSPNQSTPDHRTLSDEEKIERIRQHFTAIMETLGLDLSSPHLQDTPIRVAKMYVREFFRGLNPTNRPKIKLFPNNYSYDQMIVEKNINFFSCCEHHFVPIYGQAHVAYFARDKIIGLSKINRLVHYYARRPQVQERLTQQIAEDMQETLHTQDVAVAIEATHFCVVSRGVSDVNALTYTQQFSGKFREAEVQKNFLNHIR